MPRPLRRAVLFVGGLLLIITGLVLIVLPGPLTIPPVLLGLWLWSLEFEFARRWLRPVKVKGAIAWEQARAAPVRTTVVSVLGLVAAGIVIWTALSYHLLGLARDLVGLG